MPEGAQAERDAEYAANREFWSTAGHDEKLHALLQDLAAARCGSGRRHDPNACDSCGPIIKCIQMLEGGEL